jgi:outer membrane protein assembly factor BamB
MAHVLKLNCPNCGAPLQAQPEDKQAVCEYCRHIALLHRPNQAPPPEPSPMHHSVQVEVPRGPSLLWPAIMGMVTTLGIAGGILFFVTREVGDAMKSALPGAKDMVEKLGREAVEDKARFSDFPHLSDLNGDGVPELIGLSKVPSGEAWIAAYDGKTQKPLWKTAPLAKDASESYAKRAVVPGLVLAADALGKLQAYSDKTGEPAWAALIGERVQAFCLGEGFVRVLAADKKTHDFALDTGKRIESPAPPPSKKGRDPFADCVPLMGNGNQEGPVYSLIGWSEYDEHGLPGLHALEGITAHRALWVRGTKRAFMLGGKSEGTRYPMVAAVDGKKVLWTEVVSGADPMKSTSNVLTQLAAFADEKLAVPYEVTDRGGARMALFDAKTGKRLWDMPIHQKSHVESGLTMTKDTIYYATWTGVYLVDVATGKTRAFVGQEF